MTKRLILTVDQDFLELALSELTQAAPGVVVVANLAPGVLLCQLAQPVRALAELWLLSPPIFVRHLCPAEWELPLAASPEDIERLRTLTLAEVAPALDAGQALSVQTRIFADLPYKPFDLNTALADTLQGQTGVAINVRAPEQILSVVCAIPGDSVHQRSLTAFIGLSPAFHNLSDWAGGMRRFAREEDQVSRAEFKLLEALETFRIELSPHGVALDLGAAPGGWTRVLRQYDQYVTAVDPGELDPRLASDRAVRHRRMSAEAYLADDPDEFDLIVNDMRMDARDSARLMVACARLLYPHGFALMTLKLPEQQRRSVLDHAFKILRQGYEIAGARHLFHNRSEITVYLRPSTVRP